MVQAPRLRRGDTIGIVSPSWGGAGKFPHRVANGIAYLESQGFRTRLAPHALGRHGYVSGTAEERASDIHEMFRAPEVKAIIAAVGGDHSCHLLPHLDFDLIRESPTVFMGYSDITVLNVAIWKETGLVTFNGPARITDFAEYPAPFEYTVESFRRAVCSSEAPGRIPPALAWTEEILSWATKADLERARHLTPADGWRWLRRGTAEGPLVGGCLESLQHLRGTRFWPDTEGAVLFLETSEEHPTPATVDGILMDYENMGVFENLSALLFGRPMRYSEEEKAELRRVILERTAQYSFPVVADMDFGHTAPQFVRPIGCRARVDGSTGTFEVLESGVC